MCPHKLNDQINTDSSSKIETRQAVSCKVPFPVEDTVKETVFRTTNEASGARTLYYRPRMIAAILYPKRGLEVGRVIPADQLCTRRVRPTFPHLDMR